MQENLWNLQTMQNQHGQIGSKVGTRAHGVSSRFQNLRTREYMIGSKIWGHTSLHSTPCRAVHGTALDNLSQLNIDLLNHSSISLSLYEILTFKCVETLINQQLQSH